MTLVIHKKDKIRTSGFGQPNLGQLIFYPMTCGFLILAVKKRGERERDSAQKFTQFEVD